MQISDPHFGTELPEVSKALTRLARQLAPDVLIVSGDITQRAKRVEFEAARAFLDTLGIDQQLVIPGNHDISLFNLAARLLFPYANFKRVFGDDLEPVYESDELLIISVNTTRRYRHVDGEVSRVQIERVANLLSRAQPQQLRLVVTHQPVAVMRSEDQQDLLHRHAGAIRRWAGAGADLILGGHIHFPYVCDLQQHYPDLSRPAWAVQAGTCLSSRIRNEAGNSVNVMRYHGAQAEDTASTPDSEPYRNADYVHGTPIVRPCEIERWDYQANSDSFEKVAVYRIRCNAMIHPLNAIHFPQPQHA